MVHLRWTELGAELGLNADGVVRREELARLMSMDNAARAILEEARAHRDAAHEQAQRVISEAQAEAARQAALAETQRRAAAKLGYWQGQRQAIEDWHRQAQAGQREATARYERERERMAAVVVATVRALVLAAPPLEFYAAALALLDQQAEKSARMVLHAHPDDCVDAQAALQLRSAQWPAGLAVRVEPDPKATRHACRVETDAGYLDASLDVQLAALKRCLRDDPSFFRPEETPC